MTAVAVSNIIGAPVSGFILDHVHWLGLASWRWLLIIEGLPAIICGVFIYFVLPSRPVEARFLTDQEKAWISTALAAEQSQKTTTHLINASSPRSRLAFCSSTSGLLVILS